MKSRVRAKLKMKSKGTKLKTKKGPNRTITKLARPLDGYVSVFS